ncbi:hypothetical protein BACIH_1310 [Bacillus amyloliquefaciens]|nr:hypothetical protein U471_13390 [Bacillus amyloliquefaciens CC178]QEY88360.1 hypothetical protein BACIT_0385 [Bacillus amyloliquefaciens]QEY93065.1 hypothetical protein BACIH_1310 [Bacillus amyloliquefaciens]
MERLFHFLRGKWSAEKEIAFLFIVFSRRILYLQSVNR